MLIKKNKLSIVIPIFNENKNLVDLTLKIKKNLKQKINYEIIFIDDSSQDGTCQTLENLKKINYNLKYYIRKKKRDLSKSCFLGIKLAKFETILIMDGDGQHNPKYILLMLNIFNKKKADFVIGVRNFKKLNNTFGFLRFFLSKFIIFIFNFFLGFKTLDPMSGFFIFKKKFFLKNNNYFFGKGYKILADFIYSSNQKLNIIDYEISFLRRMKGKSKMSIKIFIVLIYFILKKIFVRSHI